jgi:predicted nucleic acid-binding protein
MIIVDTSVWIDFFKSRDTEQVALLKSAINDAEDICICGVILTEVLQGIRNDKEYELVKDMFQSLTHLPMLNDVFLKSARIYRSLRKHGITIRKPIDCMIASVAIINDIPLLHNDKDFVPIEKYHGLRSMPLQVPR